MAQRRPGSTRSWTRGLRWPLRRVREPLGTGSNRPGPSGYAEGQRLTREVMTIRSSLAPAALQEGIVRGLALPREGPATVRAALVQGAIAPGYVQFGPGAEPAAPFVAAMRLVDAGNGGSTLTYTVETWTVSDGVVAGVPQLTLLCRRIEEEARKLDPLIIVTVAVRELQEQG